MKYILLFALLLINTISFSFEEIDLDKILLEAFGSELRIGIKSMKSNKIYIKIEEGKLRVQSDGNEEILEKGTIVELYESNGYVKCKGKIYKKLEMLKGDIITLTGLSKDGVKYRNYRGRMEFISENGKIMPINTITAEEYLYSVVPSEIGKKFPAEAIKAQSVAARTYLYYGLQTKKYTNYDLMDDTSSQMYLGYDQEEPHINALINQTTGEVAVYNNQFINALYHSASGGMTSNNEDVWNGKPEPYLRAVDDKDYWKKSPRANWRYKISKKSLSKIMGYNVKYIKIVQQKNNRILKVKIGGGRVKYVSGNNLRKLLGYTNIFSTLFTIRDTGSYFIFDGHGSGHGVGMSQWGAYGMAERGFDYKSILKHYYKGIEIKNIENLGKYDIMEFN